MSYAPGCNDAPLRANLENQPPDVSRSSDTAEGGRWGRASLRAKLIFLLSAVSTAAVLLAVLVLMALDVTSARQSLRRDLGTLADVIAMNSTAALKFTDNEAGTETLAALRARPSITEAAIFDASGRLFAAYRAEDVPSAARSPRDPRNRHISVTRPIRFDRETIGAIRITSDLRDVSQRGVRFAQAGAAIVFLSVLVAIALSTRLQQGFSGPIIALAQIAREVHLTRDYSKRAAAAIGSIPKDEIGSLICRFDDMLAEIESRDAALRSHRDQLELEVEARTFALRESNVHLVEATRLAEERAEENAILSRHMHRILDGAADGIFGLDANGLATFVNASAARMFGWRVDDLAGRSLHDLIHPEGSATSIRDCPVCSGSLQQKVRVGKRTEFRLRSGRTIPVEYTASTLETPGRDSGGVVVTFRDITERQKIEQMKDEFISTVSHELRTPLTSIRGALGLLASGVLGEFEPQTKRMIAIATSNTERLMRLINDLLDLERVHSGEIRLQRRMVDSFDMIEEAVSVVQPIADRAGISLTVVPVHEGVYADPDRTVQILTNLIGNAVKFSEPGSEITISGATTEETFLFRVRDRGRGIPTDKLEAIFGRFQQVDASDSREKGGTGLGLAICRSIVEAHGGRIWAESREGEGSTFLFTIPMDGGPAEGRPVTLRPPTGDPS